MAEKKASVLLIEDNSIDPLALSKLIQSLVNSDFALETTNLLSSGLSRLESGTVDLVLLDLPLKDHHGLEAVRCIREQVAAMPVFVIDRHGDEKMAAQARAIGVRQYIRRSELDSRQIIQSMQHALELQRLESELSSTTKQLETVSNQLQTLTDIDSLTAVLNRTGLERVFEEERKRAKRGGWFLTAVLVDCDNFDRINQSFGHGVGDVVLKELVGRIKETLRPTDHVSRTGGDEFLLLLPETRFAEAMLVAEKIRLAVAESPLRLAAETVRLTASLGVQALPHDLGSIEEVLSLVRLALQESKTRGKNRVSSGEKAQISEGKNGEALSEITEILKHGDCFRAVSMPIFDLRDQSVVGYELLSRGPAGPFEMPDDLFRVSVEYNLLTAVDVCCLKTCLQAVQRPEFRHKENKKLRYHVNLFPSTIIDTPIDPLIQLFPKDVDLNRFCVEISEQQFIGDPAYLREYVMALRERGILIAIDDVGFGRSSLESLIILEPDIVKIDRKYVSGIAADPSKARSLKRLIKVVRALGSELIAEGIELLEEWQMLLEVGVHYGQGWYWGKPK